MKRIAAVALIFVLFLAGACTAKDENPKVALDTSLGTIVLELDPAKAPITVKNFLDYVDAGFYDGLIFHRVIPGFMVQGGGFGPDMTPKKGNAPIKNEADNGLKNVRGSIAMARTNVVDSATNQFFINSIDNGFLDHKDKTARGYGYAVFGKVVEGIEVIDKISAVKTGIVKRFKDVPLEPVVINKAARVK